MQRSPCEQEHTEKWPDAGLHVGHEEVERLQRALTAHYQGRLLERREVDPTVPAYAGAPLSAGANRNRHSTCQAR
jgi:hypothetical protein